MTAKNSPFSDKNTRKRGLRISSGPAPRLAPRAAGVYRDITVIEYAAILVGLLGYHIEKWPTDVTKYATMAGLFYNVDFA
ncbi:MAG: hypothetical protein LBN43_01520, partial [Oscillospiraceae bacterium]|nr:hypothetical protein [Oscillospiraceae bacterium]